MSSQHAYPELKLGMKNPEVARLKQLLNKEVTPTPNLDVTSAQFDAKTERAVKTFQQERSLYEDGVVGFTTWLALDDHYFGSLESKKLLAASVRQAESMARACNLLLQMPDPPPPGQRSKRPLLPFQQKEAESGQRADRLLKASFRLPPHDQRRGLVAQNFLSAAHMMKGNKYCLTRTPPADPTGKPMADAICYVRREPGYEKLVFVMPEFYKFFVPEERAVALIHEMIHHVYPTKGHPGGILLGDTMNNFAATVISLSGKHDTVQATRRQMPSEMVLQISPKDSIYNPYCYQAFALWYHLS